MSEVVLVAGGAGYIGSHVLLALQEAGRQVVVIDNLSTGRREAIPAEFKLYEADVRDVDAIDEVFSQNAVSAVMHFAGNIIVPESVENPAKYYRNNTVASLNLLEACLKHKVGRFVFSSTAAVYGNPAVSEVNEDTPTDPISPYGHSKLMTERMITDIEHANPWFNAVRLRYFNVAGADPLGRAGQGGPESTHLIRVALDVALKRRPILEVYGADYPTRDGTCERDFIHVSDLAAAHMAALQYLEAGNCGDVFNCGYGKGATVREVVEAISSVMDEELPTRLVPRRDGDPASLITSPDKLRSKLNWQPKYEDLTTIISTALAWQRLRMR